MILCLILILGGLPDLKINLKMYKKSLSVLSVLSILICLPVNTYAAQKKTPVNNEIKVNSKEDINRVFDIGAKLYDIQKYEEAIEIFKKITDKFPGYADAHYYIGLSYFSIGKYYLSIASFLEANKIYGTTKYDALFGAGLSYLSAGYNDEARSSFQKVIRDSKDSELVDDAKNWLNSIDEQVLQKEKIDLLTTDINFREGIEYLDKQQYAKAEDAFLRTINNKPASLLALYYLGNTMYLREKYKEATDVFNRIILISPDSKIASDARLYNRVIEEITATLPETKPLFFQLSLGAQYDSNISYADAKDTIISDIAGIGNLSLGYNINNNIQTRYSYYASVFSGINDKTPGLNVFSYDFNMQRHSGNLKLNYSLNDNLLGEADIYGNWFILGGRNFLFNGKFNPRINYYFSPNSVSIIQYTLDINNYPEFKTRSGFANSLDLSHYLYFFDNTMWLRLGYNIQKINADDKTQIQTGALTDGNRYDLLYNFTNSLLSNGFYSDVGFNLWLNSRLRLSSGIIFNNYDNNDIYRLTSPITNITTGTTEERILKNTEKKRSDILYTFGLYYSIPIYSSISANLNYNFLNNMSNITTDDYIGRSYIKHLVGLNLSYEF